MPAVRFHVPFLLGALAFNFQPAAAAPSSSAGPTLRVLDFWGVGGFFSNSITFANALLQDSATSRGYALDMTDDPRVFNAGNLSKYDVVVLNNTTSLGNVLDSAQKIALLGFAKAKGLVGINKAAETMGTWPALTQVLGAEEAQYLSGLGRLSLDTTGGFAARHPITAGLPETVEFGEMWLTYRQPLPLDSGFRPLYNLDTLQCSGCASTLSRYPWRPKVWVREASTGGRVFYMSMGHDRSVFTTNGFTKDLLLRGILWAGNRPPVPVSGVPGPRETALELLRYRVTGDGLEVAAKGDAWIEVTDVHGRVLASDRSVPGRPARFGRLPGRNLVLIRSRSPEGAGSKVVFLP